MAAKVKVLPEGTVIEPAPGQSLLAALQSRGLYVKSSCGGVASCGDCVIKVIAGEEHLDAPPFEETVLLGNVFHITRERLSCQCRPQEGEMTIDISAHDQADDEAKLKSKTAAFRTKRRKPPAPDPAKKPLVAKPREGGLRRPRPFCSDDD